jgi:hypothetical protein
LLAILGIASRVEAVQDGRIHIEKINRSLAVPRKGTPAESPAYTWRSPAAG